MRAIGRRAAVLLALAPVAACRPGSSELPPVLAREAVPTATGRGVPQGMPVSAVIGPGGGALAVPGDAVTLVVPAGSVASTTRFTATPISNLAHGGLASAWRIEADGPLAGAVQVTFKGPASYPSGASARSLSARWQDSRGFWLPPDAVTQDVGANTLTAETRHLSDWAVVLGATPALEGTYTLVQSVGTPFTATGTVALYAWAAAPEPTYYVTGTATIPSQLTWGTKVCVAAAPTQNLELGVAEVHAAVFRWGLNARWELSCTDTVTGAGSSELLATLFDTMQISLTRCPGAYAGTQVNGADFIQGAYASNCGADGSVSATWDFRSCTPGLECAVGDPCRTGVVTCTVGIPSCSESGNAPDGTSCGEHLICSSGACVCQPGDLCTPSVPCKTGAITCDTGSPVCTVTGNTPDGPTSTCDPGFVCSAGSCAPCSVGGACPSTSPCFTAATYSSCSAGPVCTPDPATRLPAGTSCGAGLACDAAGACLCAAGAGCTPSVPCKTGTIACDAGGPVCMVSGDLPDGSVSTCDPGFVCSAGACTACAAGDACPSTNPCFTGGTWWCSAGPVCTPDPATQVPAGTSCGEGLVCDAAGACLCAAGAECTPSVACKTGAITCDTGAPVCAVTGNAPDGSTSTCDPGMVCSGGACAVCLTGDPCASPNPCFTGATWSCSAGPVCAPDPATQVPAGTSCGEGLACDAAGACLCAAGGTCVPSNPCVEPGTYSCDLSGNPVCDGGPPVVDGTPCPGGTCTAGVCVAP